MPRRTHLVHDITKMPHPLVGFGGIAISDTDEMRQDCCSGYWVQRGDVVMDLGLPLRIYLASEEPQFHLYHKFAM